MQQSTRHCIFSYRHRCWCNNQLVIVSSSYRYRHRSIIIILQLATQQLLRLRQLITATTANATIKFYAISLLLLWLQHQERILVHPARMMWSALPPAVSLLINNPIKSSSYRCHRWRLTMQQLNCCHIFIAADVIYFNSTVTITVAASINFVIISNGDKWREIERRGSGNACNNQQPNYDATTSNHFECTDWHIKQ